MTILVLKRQVWFTNIIDYYLCKKKKQNVFVYIGYLFIFIKNLEEYEEIE